MTDAVIFDNVAPINAIDIKHPQQHRDRDRPFVVFQQVDIGCADPQSLGHLALRLAALLPQAAEMRADEGLLHTVAHTLLGR